jgi:hypothetical protein
VREPVPHRSLHSTPIAENVRHIVSRHVHVVFLELVIDRYVTKYTLVAIVLSQVKYTTNVELE